MKSERVIYLHLCMCAQMLIVLRCTRTKVALLFNLVGPMQRQSYSTYDPSNGSDD
jgi:hypothetical protein